MCSGLLASKKLEETVNALGQKTLGVRRIAGSEANTPHDNSVGRSWTSVLVSVNSSKCNVIKDTDRNVSRRTRRRSVGWVA